MPQDFPLSQMKEEEFFFLISIPKSCVPKKVLLLDIPSFSFRDLRKMLKICAGGRKRKII